jgi:tetratricopeptide (TPR) repeat protein
VLVGAALIILAALLAYRNSFSGPFIYDDVSAITENPTIKKLWPLSDVLSPPRDSGVTVNGRPVVNLSFALNYAIGDTSVWGYHAVNLAIHILAGLTLFGLVRRTLDLPSVPERVRLASPWIALVATLLWVVHPLQTESVTFVAQRAESIVGLFMLLTHYCFVRGAALGGDRRWLVAAVVACWLGVATKEVIVSAPLLVLLYDRAFISGTFRDAWQRHRQVYLGLAASWVLLGYLVLSTGNRGGTAGFGAGGITSWQYLMTQCHGLPRYLRLAAFPTPLIFDYGTGIERHLTSVILPGLGLVALFAGACYAVVVRPMWGFAGFWFFAILAPSSSIIPVASETLAEHRMYLPLAVLSSLAVIGASVFCGMRRIALPAMAAVLAAGWMTATRNEDYRDELRLWRDNVAKMPSNARGHNNLGEVLFRLERNEEALQCFQNAVTLLPEYADAVSNFGNALAQLGRSQEAIPHLERSLKLKPTSAETHSTLANALYSVGRIDEAVGHYQRALELKPNYAHAHNNFGVLLTNIGKIDEAITQLRAALTIKRDYPDAHYNLGNALAAKGQIAEAMIEFQETLQLKPNYAEAQINLGTALYKLGRPVEALTHFEQAVRLKPDHADALSNYGALLLESGRIDEAIESLQHALSVDPQHSSARDNLKRALEMKATKGAQPR